VVVFVNLIDHRVWEDTNCDNIENLRVLRNLVKWELVFLGISYELAKPTEQQRVTFATLEINLCEMSRSVSDQTNSSHLRHILREVCEKEMQNVLKRVP
jgi:hypothetical protein